MKSLAEQMSFYQQYHRSTKNKATHFIGVPAIVLGIMQALSWVPLGHTRFTLADALAIAVLIYYFRLDVPLAVAATILFGVLLTGAHTLSANLSAVGAWTTFGALFVGGWILQLIGHVFEGRKPALADNVFQVFIAPIFLIAEVAFALGYKPSLHEAILKNDTRHA
ncbi:MAG TPA: Mpo1-like protein [Pararobbsia sp.]|nr:Mpo1-like protein [Pararobbsia sp.]